MGLRYLIFIIGGGIDFVIKPLGRFFQVTETTDVKKYFLDIDKVNKYPVSFVIKSEDSHTELLSKIEETALKQYRVKAIVKKYMTSIEEVINIPKMIEYLGVIYKDVRINNVLVEITI